MFACGKMSEATLLSRSQLHCNVHWLQLPLPPQFLSPPPPWALHRSTARSLGPTLHWGATARRWANAEVAAPGWHRRTQL